MFSFHSSLVSFICSHSWRPLHTAVQAADVAVHEGPGSNQTLNQCWEEKKSQRFAFLGDFTHKVLHIWRENVLTKINSVKSVNINKLYPSVRVSSSCFMGDTFQTRIVILHYPSVAGHCFSAIRKSVKSADSFTKLRSQLSTNSTHSIVSRTASCSHHHLSGSWWLQKGEIVSCSPPRCRVTSWVSLTFTTVALQVGFLLNTLSQLPIIRPNKTTADCIGGLFFFFYHPASFCFGKHVSTKCNSVRERGEREEKEKR